MMVHLYITAANLYTAEEKVARVHIGDYVKEAAVGCFSEKEWENCHIYVAGGAFNCHEAVGGDKISDMTGYIAIGQMPSYEEAGRCKGCGACTYGCVAGKDVREVVAWAKEKLS